MENNYQLTPIAHKSGQSKGVARVSSNANTGGNLRRHSEVFCNVRHMLSYIDQVENENYRHSKAIDDQFQAIKQELYAALRGEQTMKSSSLALLSDQRWQPLIEEMERDLQVNQMTSTGIGRNLAALKAQIENVKKSGQEKRKTTTASYLLDTPMNKKQMSSLQYRTPMTNRIEYSSSDASSIQLARKSDDASLTGNFDVDAGLFKVPHLLSSPKRRPLTSTASDVNNGPLLTVKPSDSQRYRNVVLGLPKVDLLEMSMTGEQYRRQVEEGLHWIHRWHVVHRQK